MLLIRFHGCSIFLLLLSLGTDCSPWLPASTHCNSVRPDAASAGHRHPQWIAENVSARGPNKNVAVLCLIDYFDGWWWWLSWFVCLLACSIGRPGVDINARHIPEYPVTHIVFLINEVEYGHGQTMRPRALLPSPPPPAHHCAINSVFVCVCTGPSRHCSHSSNTIINCARAQARP